MFVVLAKEDPPKEHIQLRGASMSKHQYAATTMMPELKEGLK